MKSKEYFILCKHNTPYQITSPSKNVLYFWLRGKPELSQIYLVAADMEKQWKLNKLSLLKVFTSYQFTTFALYKKVESVVHRNTNSQEIFHYGTQYLLFYIRLLTEIAFLDIFYSIVFPGKGVFQLWVRTMSTKILMTWHKEKSETLKLNDFFCFVWDLENVI